MVRVLVFVLPLALIGCGGSQKELPTDITSPEDRKPDVEAPVPKVSDAEAVAFIKARIAHVTDKRPERLEKLKAMRQKASGRWQWPNSLIVNARRDVDAVWPDRSRLAIDYTGGGITETRMLFRAGNVSLLLNDGTGLKPADPPPTRANEETALGDMLAEVWLPTLVPATDAQAIVFDAKKQAFASQLADTVKLALPQRPVFTLWFEANTGLLGMITYSHLDQGTITSKQIIVGSHKPFDGVNLPTQFDHRRGGVSVQEWTVSKWEFPERIEDSTFDSKK